MTAKNESKVDFQEVLEIIYEWGRKYNVLKAENEELKERANKFEAAYYELKELELPVLREENERLTKAVDASIDNTNDAMRQIAAVKGRVQNLLDVLESIAHAPVPANERELLSWFVTAKNIAGGAISEWNAESELQNWNQKEVKYE